MDAGAAGAPGPPLRAAPAPHADRLALPAPAPAPLGGAPGSRPGGVGAPDAPAARPRASGLRRQGGARGRDAHPARPAPALGLDPPDGGDPAAGARGRQDQRDPRRPGSLAAPAP